MKTDMELVNSYLDGNDSAGDMIIKKYYGDVKRFLWYRCFDKSQVDDLTQETFFKILGMLKAKRVTIDENKSFKSYCFAAANSTMVDKHRENIRKPLFNKIEPPEDGDQDVFAFVGSDGYTIELELIENQRVKIVHKILSTIDEKYTAVLKLMYFEDKTEVEISTLLSIPLGTVKSRRRIGLREMKDSVVTKRFMNALR